MGAGRNLIACGLEAQGLAASGTKRKSLSIAAALGSGDGLASEPLGATCFEFPPYGTLSTPVMGRNFPLWVVSARPYPLKAMLTGTFAECMWPTSQHPPGDFDQ